MADEEDDLSYPSELARVPESSCGDLRQASRALITDGQVVYSVDQDRTSGVVNQMTPSLFGGRDYADQK